MIKKILVGLVGILFVLVIFGYFFIQGKMPQREGELQLKGLTDKVEVNYDKFGIPHISAQNDADLYRTFGYVHAQDRLFQMELLRRLSNGEMAEVFGEKLIPMDKLYRTLGLAKHAKPWITSMRKTADPKMFLMLENYLSGVNAFVKNGVRPLEFDLLGLPSREFTLEDIAAISGYMSFSFAQALYDDPLIHLLSQKFGKEYIKDLDLFYTEGFPQLPVDANLAESLAVEVSSIIHQLKPAGLFHGSNSWLISPKRSESGKAILVNDPHIAYSQPSAWYEAQLKSNNTNIYGHFLALIPNAMLGFNEKLAWGLTMFENDDIDLYLEKVNPENPEQYWAIDHWENFQSSQEIIKVKDQPDVLFELKSTRHGPIINNMLTDFKGRSYGMSKVEQPLALWWTFLDVNNQQMEAFYELPFADTLEKAAAAAEKIHNPGLNLMYANANGDIAWWATAKLPIRPAHVNSKYILDGASGKDDALGFYDFNHNPKKINPESGVLYTANNQPADMGDGLVPGYYAPKDRPLRITQLLAEKEKFSVEDMQKILLDNTTPTAKLFQQIALPILQQNRDEFSLLAQNSIDNFASWQGNHDPSEVGAVLYTRFRLRLIQLTMEDEIGVDLFESFQNHFLVARSIWVLLPNESSPWWDNVNTSETETRQQLIVQAWKDSIELLEKKLGNNLAEWTWENDVNMVYEHPLGSVEPLDKIFNVVPLPSSGGVEAINNIMLTSKNDQLDIMMGPSTRRVIDFGDITNTWGINPTGQSGVPMDEYYQDQALDYSQGKFRPQYITEEDVKANSGGLLVFVP